MKLNLCNKCGGYGDLWFIRSKNRTGFYVECLECKCRTSVYRYQKRAIKMWNKGKVNDNAVSG